MFSPPLINYFIVRRASRNFYPSFFQEFTSEWLSLYSTITAVLQGPASFPDIVAPFEERIQLRASGINRFSFIIIKPESLADILPVPFMVLVTCEDSDEQGRAYCRSHADPVLHLPTKPRLKEAGIFDATTESFRTWLDAILVHLDTHNPIAAADLRAYVQSVHRTSMRIEPNLLQLRGDPFTFASPN